MCVNRFDDETKTAMVDLYTKVDSGVDVVESTAVEEVSETGDNDCPFQVERPTNTNGSGSIDDQLYDSLRY